MSDAGQSGEATPRRGVPVWLIVLLSVLGVLVVVCGGGIWWAWSATKELRDIAALPESERPRAASEFLRKTIGDVDRPLLDFQRAVDEGRDDEAWTSAAESLRTSATRDDFGKVAATVRTRLGPAQEILLTNANFRKAAGFGDAPNGEFLDLQYQVTFEKGPGTIRATLVQVGGVWSVHSWRVESPEFLDALQAEPDTGR